MIEKIIQLRIEREELIIEKLDERYARIIYRGNKSLEYLYLMKESEVIKLEPTPPTGDDIEIDCIFLGLPKRIVIPPGTEIEMEVTLPTDIRVVAQESERKKELLTIPFELKYALYGPPDIGYLCRYIRTREKFDVSDFSMKLKISIYNRHTDPVIFSKLVLPQNFFSEKIDSIQVVIENNNQAYVFYKDEIADVFGSGWFVLKSRNKFVMNHGY